MVLSNRRLKVLVDRGYDYSDIKKFNRYCRRQHSRRHYKKQPYYVKRRVKENLRKVISKKNRLFEKKCGLSYKTFMLAVVAPIERFIQRKKETNDGVKYRSCQLSIAFRVYRTLCYLRKDRIVTLAQASGQSVSTVHRDIDRIIDLICEVLEPKHLYLPEKGSDEYNHLVGKGDFRVLKHIVYSADCCLVPIPSPVKHQSWWYHGGKKKHGLLFFCMMDGFGNARMILGPRGGAVSEPDLVWSSGFREDIKRYHMHLSKVCIVRI